MRQRTLAALASFLLIFGLVPSASAADICVCHPVLNASLSDASVSVAYNAGGGGTRQSLAPGKMSSFRVGSIYVSHTPSTTGCTTKINGKNYNTRGWVDVRWFVGNGRYNTVRIYC